MNGGHGNAAAAANRRDDAKEARAKTTMRACWRRETEGGGRAQVDDVRPSTEGRGEMVHRAAPTRRACSAKQDRSSQPLQEDAPCRRRRSRARKRRARRSPAWLMIRHNTMSLKSL